MSLRTKILSLKGLLLGLDKPALNPDPIAQFKKWFAFAKKAGCPWPTSVSLATVTPEGRPALRMMLLKGADERGFVFYTHYNGRKAVEMEKTPYAALAFHWVDLVRQVRIEGRVEKVSAEESDAYFHSRLYGSKVGAWASQQSKPLSTRAEFDRQVVLYEQQYPQEVPRPPHWGGYRVIPERIEFWQGRPNRLHDRFVYTRAGSNWTIERLYP